MSKRTIPWIMAILALAAGLAWCAAGEKKNEPLTDAQKKQIAEILSKYKPDALTAENIAAIRTAFKEARIPGGKVLDEAIAATGFDPKALRPAKKEGDDKDRKEGEKDKDKEKSKGGDKSGPQFTIEQATSDRAQLSTLAYDGMAWLTGSFYCDTFLPPGKVSDFFGFQYLRDNDAAGMGHNTSFLTRIAVNMLALLTTEQKAALIALGEEQANGVKQYAIQRFPMMKAFRRILENDVPAGKMLSVDAVKRYSADLYQLDGELVYRRAQVKAQLLRTFSAEQKKSIDALAQGNWSTWPDIPEPDKRSVPREVHVLLMTYVSELFSWYAGSVESDTYFCPEGIAKYFGAFYVKDAPAVRNPNYSIGTELTGEGGADFVKALTDSQRPFITNLVHIQRPLLKEIVSTRRAISQELRKFLAGGTADRALVISLMRRYGELDGEISYHYAMGFAAVGRTLTDEQKRTLIAIRALDAKYTPTKPFAYAEPMTMPNALAMDQFFK